MAIEIPSRWKQDTLGSSLTSIKIGGPIDYFSRPKTVGELQEDLRTAQALNLVFRVIGGGSNIVFADAGFRGLVIQPLLSDSHLLTPEETEPYKNIEPASSLARYRQVGEDFLSLKDATQTMGEPAYCELGAGMPWGQAVMWTLQQNLLGLHWYARIPCQVGGAIYNNIHGESHFLSEAVVGVFALVPGTWEEQLYSPDQLDFGYDQSRFHHSGEIITRVILRLPQGSAEAARAAQTQYLAWTAAKNTIQPTEANCGSVFQNISPEVAEAHGETSVAAAYYIDQRCNLRGEEEGVLQVSPQHGNFIINRGGGTQADFITLVQRVRERVETICGIQIVPEVECITELGLKYEW